MLNGGSGDFEYKIPWIIPSYRDWQDKYMSWLYDITHHIDSMSGYINDGVYFESSVIEKKGVFHKRYDIKVRARFHDKIGEVAIDLLKHLEAYMKKENITFTYDEISIKGYVSETYKIKLNGTDIKDGFNFMIYNSFGDGKYHGVKEAMTSLTVVCKINR